MIAKGGCKKLYQLKKIILGRTQSQMNIWKEIFLNFLKTILK